uniref:Putative response regulator n=1 Tax=Streptomyces griseoviridis TaxID=45398 RepID=B6VRR7_STRGD|nr:putative response regulator [Streptomyces griseoviridis]
MLAWSSLRLCRDCTDDDAGESYVRFLLPRYSLAACVRNAGVLYGGTGAGMPSAGPAGHGKRGRGPGPLTNIRVLVCCDRAIMSAGLRALLEQRGMEVSAETSGQQAVRSAAERRPDAVLIVAPTLTLEHKGELAELARASKVVLLTNAEDVPRSLEALCLGVRAVLSVDSSDESTWCWCCGRSWRRTRWWCPPPRSRAWNGPRAARRCLPGPLCGKRVRSPEGKPR